MNLALPSDVIQTNSVLNCMLSSGYMQKGIHLTPQSSTRHAQREWVQLKVNVHSIKLTTIHSMNTQKMLLKNYKIVSYPYELFIYLKTFFTARCILPSSFMVYRHYYTNYIQILTNGKSKNRTWNTKSIHRYLQLNKIILN